MKSIIEKRKFLLEALKLEKENLPEYNVFGDKNNKEVYSEVFKYLETGLDVELKYQDNQRLFFFRFIS